MNKYIKRELDKVKARSSEYDETSTEIYFYQSDTPAPTVDQQFCVGTKYRIQVEKYIVDEPKTFTLSANWNQGVVPKSYVMEGVVTRIQGNMIQWDLQGFNITSQSLTEDIYKGLWLPRKSITILGTYVLM